MWSAEAHRGPLGRAKAAPSSAWAVRCVQGSSSPVSGFSLLWVIENGTEGRTWAPSGGLHQDCAMACRRVTRLSRLSRKPHRQHLICHRKDAHTVSACSGGVSLLAASAFEFTEAEEGRGSCDSQPEAPRWPAGRCHVSSPEERALRASGIRLWPGQPVTWTLLGRVWRKPAPLAFMCFCGRGRAVHPGWCVVCLDHCGRVFLVCKRRLTRVAACSMATARLRAMQLP